MSEVNVYIEPFFFGHLSVISWCGPGPHNEDLGPRFPPHLSLLAMVHPLL